jgi:hypothetical protein
MNSATLVKVFGVVFLLIGVLGFVPGITNEEGLLLGLFEVDAMHNIVHILSGVLAFVFAGKSPKTYLKVFGVVYLLVTIVGFVQGDTILGMMSVNMADHWLHLAIAVVALVFGFKKEGVMASATPNMSMPQ